MQTDKALKKCEELLTVIKELKKQSENPFKTVLEKNSKPSLSHKEKVILLKSWLMFSLEIPPGMMTINYGEDTFYKTDSYQSAFDNYKFFVQKVIFKLNVDDFLIEIDEMTGYYTLRNRFLTRKENISKINMFCGGYNQNVTEAYVFFEDDPSDCYTGLQYIKTKSIEELKEIVLKEDTQDLLEKDSFEEEMTAFMLIKGIPGYLSMYRYPDLYSRIIEKRILFFE